MKRWCEKELKILIFFLLPLFSAQSQMMGRAAAGAFYSPFHSMWTGFSNSSSSSQKYSGSGNSSSAGTAAGQNSFGYPPTPPKDSSTPDQPLSNEDNGYGHHMNNNNVVANNSVSSETKPSTEHLMNSISSLSAYAGLPGSSASRKLPEGTNSSQQYSEGSMFYYPTSSDLAMYGSSSYGNRPLQSSRPKSKNRSNAGKYEKTIEWTNWCWWFLRCINFPAAVMVFFFFFCCMKIL